MNLPNKFQQTYYLFILKFSSIPLIYDFVIQFDTNYNIFRFVLAQERLHYRNKGIIVRESAKGYWRYKYI
jgi:hypothetical protein